MIGRLRGSMITLADQSIVVDVNGVGYEVHVSPRTAAELPGVGEEVVVHVHLHVREDAMVLYGFTDSMERNTFRLLLGVSGVGPKVGLAILGSMRLDELRRAVATEDVDALTVVPGIGKRSAQKLLLELKPKLVDEQVESLGGDSDAARIREALEGLGYGAAEISEALANAPVEGSVEDRLRNALRVMGQR